MVTIFAIFIIGVLFTSSLSLGVRIISDKGMVLYPLREKALKVNSARKKEINKQISVFEAERTAAIRGENPVAYEMAQEQIERLEMKLFYVNMWHKPLLTCSTCMASFYGVLTSCVLFSYIGTDAFIIAPFYIMGAAVLNTFIFKFY